MYALEVIHPGGYTDEQLKELPEVKALILIQEIFRKDTPLKKLSPQERQEKRDTEVRPTMKAYLDFVHSLNPEDLSLSEKSPSLKKPGMQYLIPSIMKPVSQSFLMMGIYLPTIRFPREL